MNLPDVLPCKCTNTNCGITFMSRNPVGGGGSNFVFQGNMTNCPKCGQRAHYADWSTDSAGKFYLAGFFSELKAFRDVGKLKALKSELKAANDSVTAQELADVLVEIDPNFQKFKQAIASIPAGKIASVIQTLVAIITLLVLLNQSTSDAEFKEEQIELQKDQFEYQKERDRKSDSDTSESEKEIDSIQRQINSLQEQLQQNLEENRHDRNLDHRNSNRQKAELKGNCRNKPCPCGSGKKSKKCHPYGYLV
jgi:hypothetical protein